MKVPSRTILMSALQPRATLLRRLPWAIIFWPFRPFLYQLILNFFFNKRFVFHKTEAFYASEPVVSYSMISDIELFS
jgi:hypothetical protein